MRKVNPLTVTEGRRLLDRTKFINLWSKMFQRNVLTSEYIYLNILYQGSQNNVNFTSKNLTSDKWKPARGRQVKFDKANQQTSLIYGMAMNNKYP